MQAFYLLEITVSLFVLIFQFYSFFNTKRKIHIYRSIFPNKDFDEKFIEQKVINDVEVELLREGEANFSPSFQTVLSSINRYVAKNKGAVDFAIIRSIVERNIQAKENEISSVISLPLYIGLMGTFLGVILGLLRIAFFGGISDANISTFIGGILIAMTASLTGLMLSVINNSGNFKRSKVISDERKNIFFNFLQVELLPHLGNSLYDALDRLKVNINDFNEKFSNNVRMFDSNFSANVWHLKDAAEKLADNIDPIIESTQLQKEFLQTLKTIGYNRMAEANIKVFNLMKQAGPQFVEFIQKQKELNESVAKTAGFVTSIENVMNRVKTFEEGVNRLGERIDNADYMGSDLLKKVNRKMEELDNQFEVLKQHSQKSNKEIQEFFDREYDTVSTMVSHIRSEIQRALDFNIDNNPLQKLHLLDKLHELENFRTLILDNKETLGKVDQITKEAEGTKQALVTIQERLSSIDTTLIDINKNDSETEEGGEENEDNDDEEQVGTEERTEGSRSIWGKLFGSNGKHS